MADTAFLSLIGTLPQQPCVVSWAEGKNKRLVRERERTAFLQLVAFQMSQTTNPIHSCLVFLKERAGPGIYLTSHLIQIVFI